MRIMTEQNLRDAFSGESQAHMKYQIYSKWLKRKAIPTLRGSLKQLPMLNWSMHATI